MNTAIKTLLPAVALCVLAVACQKDSAEPNNVLQEVETKGPMDVIAIGIPDLVVTFLNTNLPVQVSPCSATPMPDATCTVPVNNGVVTMSVRNIGTAAAVGGFSIGISPQGAGPYTQFIPSTLAPGATVTRSWTGFAFSSCQGAPFIGNIVGNSDVWNDIAESNETNNISRPYNYCTN